MATAKKYIGFDAEAYFPLKYTPMAERVVPFGNLSAEDRSLIKSVNWLVKTADGQTIPDWTEVIDSRYGALTHVAIINDEMGTAYDKVDLDFHPAAFVVVYRRNGNKVEFLLPTERRPLLIDEDGNQGTVTIRNVPQGLLRGRFRGIDIESPLDAAVREVKEETGLRPKTIDHLGDIYLDAANSHVAMPFFLVEVDAGQTQYRQTLETSEEIKVGKDDWFALEDIPALKLQCAKTLAGLMLATGYLGLWNNTEDSTSGSPQQ